MKHLETIYQTEKEMLLKFPAYIWLLAVNKDDGLNEVGKKAAIKSSQIEPFTCDPLFSYFYKQADEILEEHISLIDNQLAKGKDGRETVMKEELGHMEPILKKLGEEYAATMHRKMQSIKDHVSKAHRSVLEYFVLPVTIKGLTV